MLQEVDTRFGTTHTVVERLIDSYQEETSSREEMAGKEQSLLASLFQIPKADSTILLTALWAIVNSFGPVRHILTEMESQQRPMMHAVLPSLELLKQK